MPVYLLIHIAILVRLSVSQYKSSFFDIHVVCVYIQKKFTSLLNDLYLPFMCTYLPLNSSSGNEFEPRPFEKFRWDFKLIAVSI